MTTSHNTPTVQSGTVQPAVFVCFRKHVKGRDPAAVATCIFIACDMGQNSEIHRKQSGEGRTGLKILCGCCGSVYRVMEELSNHINTEALHLRLSTIPGYTKESFDLNDYFAKQRDQNALDEAVAIARSAASAGPG